ncbi:MAG: SRPBCC domain-containing protein [Rhizomicrobium sp.]
MLEIVRRFDATPETVFDAWLEKEQWQAWLGPQGVRCEITQFEPRVGGPYRLIMNLPDGRQLAVHGEFKSLDRPRRFSLTWGSEGDTLVSVSLRAVGGGTELTLRHEGLARGDHESFAGGWNGALDKLARHVKGETP